uniref:Uncharacterized protein n=1 Tax=Felis catus TaxID=9685 RepID=A0ABI7XWP9_FELCA
MACGRNFDWLLSPRNFLGRVRVDGVARSLTCCTRLSKINIVNDEKVKRVNKAFVDIQKELAHFSKGLSLEPLQKQLIPQQCHENESVNVDEATRLMAQL